MNGEIICKQFEILENVKTFYEDICKKLNEIDTAVQSNKMLKQ